MKSIEPRQLHPKEHQIKYTTISRNHEKMLSAKPKHVDLPLLKSFWKGEITDLIGDVTCLVK